MRNRTSRNRGGFTILELLVVIFIMLAMTGIAVAAFQQFLDAERIKLAGGQVVSAIRMARQYAMSRRTKVMVELLDPAIVYDEQTVEPTVTVCYTREDAADTNYSGELSLHEYNESNNRYGYAKFDLSGVQTLVDQGYYVTEATLYLKSDSVKYDGKYATVKKIDDDSWVPGDVTWNSPPTTAGDLSNIADMRDGEWRSINVTDHVAAEVADGVASFRFGSEYYYMYTCTTKLEVSVEKDITDYEARKQMARHVRIIPYVRVRNADTGGFAWMLDQDSGALKTMELPLAIEFALTPARSTVTQYDPGDPEGIEVKKVWLDLNPDGTCVGREPNVEGWTDRVNTVILRDSNVGDLCLLYIPPSSGFTRQRYLFGDEVDAFIAAYSLYSLW